jgi:hypothetical protein
MADETREISLNINSWKKIDNEYINLEKINDKNNMIKHYNFTNYFNDENSKLK